ncbi:MAG: hypothetical protein HRT47_04805 [Candidatus Caenarcaniphilales bacterium]|nr:hypothetical protein [Candidatus Caenarcaniphilales bacterium]
MKRYLYLFLVLAALEVYSLASVNATELLVDSINLTSTKSSQNITVSLDEIPQALIKKGQLKNAKLRFKFKLDRSAKRDFTLSPKNGRVIVEIRDGEIIPGALTVTANDTSKTGSFNYNLIAPKRIVSKFGVNSKPGTINVSNSFEISGLALIPSGDISNFSDSDSPAAVEIQIEQLNLQGLEPLIIGEGQTNSQGEWSINITEDPQASDTPNLVAVLKAKDESNDLRVIITDFDLNLIDPYSEYLAQVVLDSEIDLSKTSKDEIKDLDLNLRNTVDLSSANTSTEAINLCEEGFGDVADGFSGIVIGRDDGTGSITLGTNLPLNGLISQIGFGLNLVGGDQPGQEIIGTNNFSRLLEGVFNFSNSSSVVSDLTITDPKFSGYLTVNGPAGQKDQSNQFVVTDMNDFLSIPNLDAPAPVLLLDSQGKIEIFNSASSKVSGIVREDSPKTTAKLTISQNGTTVVGNSGGLSTTTDTNVNDENDRFGAYLFNSPTFFSSFVPDSNNLPSFGNARVYGLDFYSDNNESNTVVSDSAKCEASRSKRQAQELVTDLECNVTKNFWVFDFDDPVIPLGPDEVPVTVELRMEPKDPSKIKVKEQKNDLLSDLLNNMMFINEPNQFLTGFGLPDYYFINSAYEIPDSTGEKQTNGTSLHIIINHADLSILSGDPLTYDLYWFEYGINDNNKFITSKNSLVTITPPSSSNNDYIIDFGPIHGQEAIIPLYPTLNELLSLGDPFGLPLLGPSILDPLDPDPGFMPVPPDPSIGEFELATQGVVLNPKINFSISKDKELLVGTVNGGNGTNNKSVGLAVGVRVK